MQFEWDLEKADENVRKHGVSFEEAMSVFGDSLARIHSDPDHSEAESREVICGHTAAGRLLLGILHGRIWKHPTVLSTRSNHV